MKSINNMNKKKFISLFGNIFENSKWIAEETYKKKPFSDYNEFKNTMINIFKKTSQNNQLKILLNHPDLTGKIKISNTMGFSKKEQQNSKLYECSKSEFDEFNDLNTKYKNKFGFPFILSVVGKNKNEILETFKKRILLNQDIELQEAILQVEKIATIRLNSLNKLGYE